MKNAHNWLYSFILCTTYSWASTSVEYCGGGDYDYASTYYRVVDQFKMVDPAYHGLLNCPDELFCAEIPNSEDGNLKEWQAYLGGDFSASEIKTLIYGSTYEWYASIYNGSGNGTLSRKLNTKKHRFFIEYMMLAKSAEDASSDHDGGYGWYQGEKVSKTDKNSILQKAFTLLSNAPDDYMRNRVAFQAIRAAHYLQYNGQAISIFKDYVNKTSNSSYIYYRALEQVSGAYYNQKNIKNAITGFLQVYNNLPERRYSNTLSLKKSFELLEQDYPDLVLNDPAIEEAFLFFTNYTNRDENMQAMEKLAALNPNSPYLDVLMTRYLDNIQSSVFAQSNYSLYDQKTFNLDRIKLLSNRILKDARLEDKDRYKLLLGLISIMENDSKGIAYLKEIKSGSKYYEFASRLQFLTKVHAIKGVDNEAFNTLFVELDNTPALHNSDAVTAAFFNHIASLYDQAQNPIAAYLTRVDYSSYHENITWVNTKAEHGYSYQLDNKYDLLDEQIINNFMSSYANLKNPSAFEKVILGRLKVDAKDFAHDLLGTRYLQQNELEKAKDHFTKIKSPSDFWEEKVRPELFSQSIKEYMDTDFEQRSDQFHKKYTDILGKSFKSTNKENYYDNKLKLISILQNLESKAKSSKTDNADYYYMLGNAWYNMSAKGWFVNNLYYVGNDSRNALLPYSWNEEDLLKEDRQEVLDISSSYLSKAINSKGDKETKAKAIFALARTNQCSNSVWDSNTNSYDFFICGDHKQLFKQLTREYSDTAYYQEILRECTWFAE